MVCCGVLRRGGCWSKNVVVVVLCCFERVKIVLKCCGRVSMLWY